MRKAITRSVTRSATRSIWGTALALVVATACGYSPNPESGTLKCGSSNSCPEGYSCSSGRCWKDGAGGTGGSSSGHGGSGGGGGSAGAASKFIGTWRFVSPSSRMIACTDGSSENKDWSNLGESFDVSVGPVSALTTYYYCDWDLDVASGGTSTVIKPGAACSGDDGATPPTTYTWHGMLFTLSTSNGQSGTLVADLPFDYSSTAGSGSCTMHFTGTMTKN